MGKRTLGLVATTLVMVLLPLAPARACSCAYGDPREQLAASDAAFIGEFVSSRPGETPSGSSDDDTIYTFDVSEEFKVDLPDPLDVHSAASGISCGLEVSPGETYAFFLRLDENDNWISSLCQQVDPDELREAAEPLPEPDGKNPVRFLAGGGFGEGRMVALDKRGRTLAYGYGKQNAGWFDACPGGRRSVEAIYNNEYEVTLVVRRLSDFGEIGRRAMPFPRYSTTRPALRELLCRDQNARSVLAFASTYNKRSKSRLIEVTPKGVNTLHRGTAFVAHLTRTRAFLASGVGGREIKVFDISSGRVRSIVDLGHPYVDGIGVDRRGRYLSAINEVYGDGKPARLYVIEINSGDVVASRALGAKRGGYFATSTWLSGHRLLLLPTGGDNSHAEVFDFDLDRLGSFRWDAYGGVIWRGSVYGIEFEGRLLRAPLTGGPAETLRRMVSAGIGGLTIVPGDTDVEFEMPD